MGRPLPLWVYLLSLILWMVITVLFGWTVKSKLGGSERTGAVGDMAVQVASFPSLAKDAFEEIFDIASGDYRDEALRVMQEEPFDTTGFRPFDSLDGSNVRGLQFRAEPGSMAEGWRVLVGAFALGEEVQNAALLLAPDLTIVRKWVLDEVPVDGATVRPGHRKFAHGLEVLPDGSFVFTFDGGVSLQRMDACGNRIWVTGGAFSHSVTRDDSGSTLWGLRGDVAIVQVATADGVVVRSIAIDDIVDANPMIDVLELRRIFGNDLGRNRRNTKLGWPHDSLHLNDVEPLPATMADAFPDFRRGDLLVSARSLNLVFVLDPDTLEIKWWRVGQWQRQHDPDWLPTGEIMVFNNRMSRDFSEIVAIDPATFERRTVFDGRRNGFYTRIRGKSQMLDSGALIITSAQQGRAFEVSPGGEVVFEVLNLTPDDEPLSYAVSELRWLPPDYFERGLPSCGEEVEQLGDAAGQLRVRDEFTSTAD